MKKFLFAFLSCGIFFNAFAAGGLSGTAAVSITSDTAANAKEMAFDEARRQIITESLSQYVNPEQLTDTVRNATKAELTNLISSSSIEGEKQSDTTYSANITMSIDKNAAKQWLMENDVQNWLTDDTVGDKFILQAVMSDKLANWMELKQIAREEGIDLSTRYINGKNRTEIRESSREIRKIK